jgi:RimJ/RimL family protein N-acetyltransferase
MAGRRCRLEPLDADRHAAGLFAAYAADREGRLWSYLPYGPFEGVEDYRAWALEHQAMPDAHFYAIVAARDGAPVGVGAFLRIAPEAGSIEVGHLCFSPAMGRTAIATEAMFLMMRRVFEDWGYRRYEWKCHADNAPSMRAAERLGFRFEGLFRNSLVVKGRNRDTAWFSITDDEWPELRRAFSAWLDDANFDAEGGQREGLAHFMPETAGRPIVELRR